MPCDSIIRQEVSSRLKNAMAPLVEATLDGMPGWTVTQSSSERVTAKRGRDTIEWIKGKGLTLTARGTNSTLIPTITREYSKQAVSWAAQRAGWQVQSTEANRLTVTRR